MRGIKLTVLLDGEIKLLYKSKCILRSVTMAQQTATLLTAWINSDSLDLTNQARLSSLAKSKFEVILDQDTKIRFASKCAAENVSMSQMVETLILDWVNRQ